MYLTHFYSEQPSQLLYTETESLGDRGRTLSYKVAHVNALLSKCASHLQTQTFPFSIT